MPNQSTPLFEDESTITSESAGAPWNPYITLPDEMTGFELGELIGNGSTGQVYRAMQYREFAVKIIYCNTESRREMARHEYELGKLFDSCDEAVHSVDYYEKDHQSFIVMEYGVPCLAFFSNRETRTREILNAILRISSALEKIHAQGYTHFDVKPENILMVKKEAKLADFSHCSHFVPDQTYDRPLGTGIYMAPEIKAGGKYTGREDMYSLGISMYTLLMAGRKPFDFSDRQSKRREREDQIESLFIHPELLTIIQKAAAFDADDRYMDFHAFSEDLRAFMEQHQSSMDDEMPMYRILPMRPQFTAPFNNLS